MRKSKYYFISFFLVWASFLSAQTAKESEADISANAVGRYPTPDLTVGHIVLPKGKLSPNQDFKLSWEVRNLGQSATGKGWKEHIFLQNELGQRFFVGDTYYKEALAAEQVVSRAVVLTLPSLLGLDGKVNVVVELVPTSVTGESEADRGNNTAVSAEQITVKKRLFLEGAESVVREDAAAPLRFRLSRSGSWETAETFLITTGSQRRLTVPKKITIPEGQSGVYFEVSVVDNKISNDYEAETLEVAMQHGYGKVEQSIRIIDDEHITLTASLDRKELTEGEILCLVVTTPEVLTADLPIVIHSDAARRFQIPTDVVMAKGTNSVTIDLPTVDNDEVEPDIRCALKVQARNSSSSVVEVLLKDNDIPELTLEMSTKMVSEGDGADAAVATIKRLTNVDKEVTIILSTTSNDLYLVGKNKLVLEKGVKEKDFTIGALDNAVVDGNREAEVTATVYVPTVEGAISDRVWGTASAVLTVLDNDGPTLTLQPGRSSFLMDATDNELTVTRNAHMDQPLTLRLSSLQKDVLNYEESVVIPAGKSSVTVMVDFLNLSTQQKDCKVNFLAVADGYTSGSCWILLTNEEKGDAVISSFTTQSKNALAGDMIPLEIEVKNIGRKVLEAGIPVLVATADQQVVKFTTKEDLNPGTSVKIHGNYTLPGAMGKIQLNAVVNPDQKVTESLYTNNAATPLQISLAEPYQVKVAVDKAIYQQKDKVKISGTLTGKFSSKDLVEVYLINDGIRQTLQAETDEQGHFETTYTLLEKQCGHFVVGACYPKTEGTAEMAAFDVCGLSTKGFFTSCELGLSETYEGELEISNPGSLFLRNSRFERWSDGQGAFYGSR